MLDDIPAGERRALSGKGWKRPRKRRVRAIRDRLRSAYGRPRLRRHRSPLDELVRTVLSQNTNDRNRDIAFGRLRDRFSTWEEVRDAPEAEIEEAIRPGGISRVKSERIKRILDRVAEGPDRRGAGRSLSLDWIEEAPSLEARKYLQSLPGVGRKTAACVLLFSYGIPEFPVDTHVYRTASRLGLTRPGAPFEEAHEIMLAITDPEDAYEIHMNLVQHGRQVCKPKPLCEHCPLRRMCPYVRELRR